MTAPDGEALAESAEHHLSEEVMTPTDVNVVRPSSDQIPQPTDGGSQMTLQLVEDVADDVLAPEPDPAKPDERFKLWTPQDLIDSNTPPVWTAKGLIIQPTYGMLAGAEKSLKSYIAQFIAVGAAAGVPIFGQFEVPTPIPTLMMVGEGGRLPYTRRLDRIARAYGVRLADLPMFSTFDVASTLSDQFRTSLVRNLKELWPGLVIIEPFYAFTRGVRGQDVARRG